MGIRLNPFTGLLDITGSSGGGGSGTVTSVALDEGSTTPIYDISGSPVTGSGTLTFSLKDQPANFVFAGPETGADSEPTFRALVESDIPDLSDQFWSLVGNTGTSGTSVLGTTDAQPWTTISNGIFIDAYQIDGSVSSIQNIIPVDNTAYNQKKNQVNLNPNVGTTAANFTNSSNSVAYDGAGLGYNYDGNIVVNSTSLSHNGDGTVAYFSNTQNNAFFATLDGHTQLFKGVDMNAGVAAGYIVDNFNNIFSSMNSTGGIFGGINLYGGGLSLTDIESGNVNGDTFNINIDGASVLSQGVTSFGSSINIGGTTTVANNLQGSSNTISIQDDAQANGGVTANNTNVQVKNNATSNHITVTESDLAIIDAAVVNGSTMHQINYQLHDAAEGGNSVGVNNGFSLDGTAVSDGYTLYNAQAQISGTPTLNNNLNLYAAGTNITGGSLNSIYALTMPTDVGGTTTLSGQYESIFTNLVLKGSATANTMIGTDINLSVQDTATVSGQIAGAKININTTGLPHNGNLEGLEINISGATLDPAYMATGGQKQGLIVNDGSLNSSYDYDPPAGLPFFGINSIGANVHVQSGTPIDSLAFINNLGSSVQFDDDWTLSPFGIGPVMVNTAGMVIGASGKTMDEWNGILVGGTNPAGAGAITNAYAVRNAGLIGNGGSLAITNLYGYSTFGGFGSNAANKWAFYDANNSENYLDKLAIGTSNKKVANSDTSIEIGNKKALLHARVTTTEKNALTALEGMEVYDTDLKQLQFYDGTSWIEDSEDSAWLLSGNSGSTPGTDFIGTTDAQDLVFKTNSVEFMRITDATDTLDISGNISATKTVTDSGNITALFSATSNTTVDGSNTTVGLQGVSTALVQSGATNDKSVGVVNTVTRGDGTDDGTLSALGGQENLIFINSGSSGITSTAYGVLNLLFLQQGHVGDYYDFFSQVNNGSGVIDGNHFGIYLNHDSVTPIKSWLSGSTRLGGTSFVAPQETLDVTGSVRLDSSLILEDPGAGTESVTIQSPTLAGSYTFTLPTTLPATTQAIISDNTGQLSYGSFVVSSNGDINETSFTAADNQASPDDVTGFSFANADVRSFEAQVSIVRDATYANYSIKGIQKASTWEMSQTYVGDNTGLIFTITNSGQIQYTSSSTGFTALIKFRALVTGT